MNTIDRGEVRQHAEWVIANCTEGIGAARDVLKLLAALEQAEAERHTYRAKMDELDRAYLSEHEQRKRIEKRVRAVRDILDENPAAYARTYNHDIRRALDGD